jgi:ATP-dependent DNA helicase HFM1/MER3
VQEKVRDWKQKFGSLGISCLEMTGDNEFFNFKSIQDSDIILTTPEVNKTLFLFCFPDCKAAV